MMQGKAPCIWGNGKQSRDFIYVSDVAEANLAALKYEGGVHIFNIGTGENNTVNNVGGMLQSHFRCYNVDHDPAFREPVQKICLDNALAKQELKWEPQIELYKGLMETAVWFQERAKPK
jgi:UDP-glucose 4-epimerase